MNCHYCNSENTELLDTKSNSRNVGHGHVIDEISDEWKCKDCGRIFFDQEVRF